MLDHFHARVAGHAGADQFGRPVAAAVVDHDDLALDLKIIQGGQRVADGGLDVPFLIEGRHHHGERQSRRRGRLHANSLLFPSTSSFISTITCAMYRTVRLRQVVTTLAKRLSGRCSKAG